MPWAQSHYRQVREHISTHAARSVPPSASAGAHVNACRALRAAIGKCRCTCQCMPRAQGRSRQAQVHMPMHAARSEPPATSAGAHINACRALIATIGKRGCTCQRMPHLKTAIGNRRCTFQCIPCAQSRQRQAQVHISTHAARSTPPVEASAQHQLMPLIPSRRRPARQYLRSARPVSPRQLRTVFTIAKNPSVGT